MHSYTPSENTLINRLRSQQFAFPQPWICAYWFADAPRPATRCQANGNHSFSKISMIVIHSLVDNGCCKIMIIAHCSLALSRMAHYIQFAFHLFTVHNLLSRSRRRLGLRRHCAAWCSRRRWRRRYSIWWPAGHTAWGFACRSTPASPLRPALQNTLPNECSSQSQKWWHS